MSTHRYNVRVKMGVRMYKRGQSDVYMTYIYKITISDVLRVFVFGKISKKRKEKKKHKNIIIKE